VSDQLREYPTDRIVGIATDDRVAQAVRERLASTGIPGIDVEVVRPSEEDAATTDDDAASDGLLAGVRRLFGDETPHLERHAAALRQGACVLLVTVPDADELPDDDRDGAKERIGDAMVDAGALDVTYFGRWAVEQLGHEA
jgi:hypothetical protein